jgi:hypothetical protein
MGDGLQRGKETVPREQAIRTILNSLLGSYAGAPVSSVWRNVPKAEERQRRGGYA